MRDVDVKGELLVEEIEVLIGGIILHEVGPRTDVLAVGIVGDELEGECIAAGGDTIGTAVVGAVESAILHAGRRVGAESRVPGVSGVAVGVPRGGMDPAPVGIEDDLAVDSGTPTSLLACLPGESRVGLSRVRAHLLGRDDSEEGQGKKGCD